MSKVEVKISKKYKTNPCHTKEKKCSYFLVFAQRGLAYFDIKSSSLKFERFFLCIFYKP